MAKPILMLYSNLLMLMEVEQ